MRYVSPDKTSLLALVGILIGFTVYHFAYAAGPTNGFDLSNSILPRAEILHGGPPRDGIPAISNPEMIAAAQADFIDPEHRVVGIRLHGEARAYPIGILNWHEIVNDTIDGRRFAITFCPLCGTAVAFDATIDGKPTDFGVSGLLYNSDVLLYDRDTESLWSQIMGRSISGERVGMKLEALPISHTTWRDWLKENPDTMIMSADTGYSRDYNRNPYAGYEQSRHTYFAVNHQAPDSYHPKEVVYGLEVDGVFRAYPFIELDRQGKASFSDTVNGQTYHFDWDSENRSLTVTGPGGGEVAGIQGFWFAWFAFHPDTQVFKAAGS